MGQPRGGIPSGPSQPLDFGPVVKQCRPLHRNKGQLQRYDGQCQARCERQRMIAAAKGELIDRDLFSGTATLLADRFLGTTARLL